MFFPLRRPYFAASISICLLVLSLLSVTTHLSIATATLNIPPPNSSFLHLNVDLNLSTTLRPLPTAVKVDGNRLFLPILSSLGFYNLSSTGFSFGYLVLDGRQSLLDDVSPSFQMAVCGGLLGNLSDLRSYGTFRMDVNVTSDGYVVPLWIANGAHTRPLTSEAFSLVVVHGAAPGDGNVLQLVDHTTGTVVWSVPDAGMMQMQDTGNLVIYDTVDKTKVVWQSLSQPRDTLFQGQKLTAGMELRSNDSAYIARMEKGGLVVYLNKVRFIEHPAAYWVFPLFFPSMYSHPTISRPGDLRKQLLELPCEPSYMALENDGYNLAFATLDLEPGRCTAGYTWTTHINLFYGGTFIHHQFLRLEIDGRLYSYGVDSTVYPASTTRIALDRLSNQVGLFDWGECAAPMACGPLGVCTPYAPTLCSSPSSLAEAGTPHFEFINSTDISKGCRLGTPLPKCILGHEHIGTTSYLQVNETATVFLFGGWPFDFVASPRVDKCMKLCSANCSCTGFFYQATNSACFFMTDAIGLLRIKDQSNVSSTFYFILSNGKVLARSFTTYLKINSSPAPPRKHVATIIEASAPPRKHVATIIEALASTVVFLLILGSVLYLLHATKRKRKRDKARQAEDEELRDILPHLPSRFLYNDLHKATKGFTKLLGAGGCGSVYAGVLLDGRKVAVKVLEVVSLKGQQSKQFLAEVATLGRSNHHNIVCLVGFCWEVCHRLLVYEYMEKGSLDQWLFAKGVDVAKRTVPAVMAPLMLDWPTRYNVALGIARGLTYLHEDCLQPILHFDIKPQNILLDDAYVAKLADFGLSKLMQRGISEVVTGVRGTPGYIAPEMHAHGAVSKKSDVYSMGMVMLEIVGGRKNIDITLLNSACDEWHFPSWAAKKCEQGLMLELVDKRIGQAYDKEQACRLIQTAFWCIHDIASKRPSASTIVQWLEGKCFISQPPYSVIANTGQSSVEEVTPSF